MTVSRSKYNYVKWIHELDKSMTSLVGGKAANLGEMTKLGIPVPPGFAITADAFREFIRRTGIADKIYSMLREIVRRGEPEEYREASRRVREMIESTPIPKDIEDEIRSAYRELCNMLGVKDVAVAVRSSATAEDLPDASFAGQQDTYLNVRGEDNVVYYVKKVWSSLFTPRAIAYRDAKGIPHDKTFMSVVVQKLVNSRSSGVMFTLDPATGDRSKIVIESAWGLGEGVVSGRVTPDVYVIDKSTMRIVEKRIADKRIAVVRDEAGLTREVALDESKSKSSSLTDEEAIRLAEYALALERHYNHPLDIEWTVDADLKFPNNIFIVQCRYETAWSRRAEVKEVRPVARELKVVAKGLPASPGTASGRAKICLTIEDAKRKMSKGDILVTKMTNPDWVPYMRIAAAIVTDEGGMTSHAAIVSRELGIPAVVGAGNATQVLRDGEYYTVDGSKGVVYEGVIEVERRAEEKAVTAAAPAAVPKEIIIHIYRSVRTAAGIYMNLGVPEKIDEYKDLPFDGIGLMRIEFTISSVIGEHPLYLIEVGKQDKFVNLLSDGIVKVASAVYPRPVIVRFSDFKTNEYRQLAGGEKYEPEERNPMLGWRGVSRYVSPKYVKAFKLELEAVKKAREAHGLKNVHVMVPFVRAPWELKTFNKLLEEVGLVRGRDFKVVAMAEVPSVALIVEEFAEYVDGFSIGSNDLTQLVMGVDRDNDVLVRESPAYFDERELPVLKAMYDIIKRAKRMGKSVGICGQAPSVYPEIVEFLVRAGIDYLSVNPDAVIETRLLVDSIERKILLEKLSEITRMLKWKDALTADHEEFKEIVFRVFGGKTI